MKRTAFVLMLLMTSLTGLVAGITLCNTLQLHPILLLTILSACIIGTAASILVYHGEK
jgi:hypothetical protein